MSSLACPLANPAEMTPSVDIRLPPELDEASYSAAVLLLDQSTTETSLDDELAIKAGALGISISRPSTSDKRNTSSAESASTVATFHARTFSSASNDSGRTTLTSYSSFDASPSADTPIKSVSRRGSKTLNFSQYEKYLAQVDPNINQPKFLKGPPPEPVSTTAPSLFSVSTRGSYVSFKRGLKNKMRWRKKPIPQPEPTVSVSDDSNFGRPSTRANELKRSCVCCRDDFAKSAALQSLPCGHTYCGKCLRIMIQQAMTDESKMPPRCCTQPIPSTTVKTILTREEQYTFLKAVLQFSTPWESRIFCPNTSCAEFIPPRHKIDPKHPFDVVCRKCRTRVCVMCKRDAHPIGQDCPEDWELDAVLKMGERSGWRRCYKCRTLVELSQGCTHMTCRCRAQFCYICGAVWDPAVGCPNFCNGEEEMERRRIEEEARAAELEAEKAAQEAAAALAAVDKAEAEKRTQESEEFKQLQEAQKAEMERFRIFVRKTKWVMWTRHSEKKLALVDKYNDQIEKMEERHTKTASHLEDRQIAAEMELRTSLEQAEKSIRIRIKHMEAYCDGLGRAAATNGMPARVVTERDLRELGQQYNIRDNMKRLHESKVDVMRERQTQRMEELLERQVEELQKIKDKRDQEVENLNAEFALDEDTLVMVFNARKHRVQKRWEVANEILRKELVDSKGVKYALPAIIPWPEDPEANEEVLEAVQE
jgi:hypothetical protein